MDLGEMSITTSSTILATWPPRVGNYSFVGCYTDNLYNRTLTGTGALQDLSNQACSDHCTGFTYWGTEYGQQCFCGNHIAAQSDKVATTECNTPCLAADTEFCGGDWRLSLYVMADGEEGSSPTGTQGSTTVTMNTITSQTMTTPAQVSTSRGDTSSTEIPVTSTNNPNSGPSIVITDTSLPTSNFSWTYPTMSSFVGFTVLRSSETTYSTLVASTYENSISPGPSQNRSGYTPSGSMPNMTSAPNEVSAPSSSSSAAINETGSLIPVTSTAASTASFNNATSGSNNTSPATVGSSTGSSSAPAGKAAGIAFGVIAAVALLAGLAWYLMKKTRRSSREKQKGGDGDDEEEEDGDSQWWDGDGQHGTVSELEEDREHGPRSNVDAVAWGSDPGAIRRVRGNAGTTPTGSDDGGVR